MRAGSSGPPSEEREIASRIEHTLLRADATASEIDALCAEAIDFGFAGVCVAGVHVARAAAALSGTPCRVVTVVGFPLGSTSSAVKAFEAARAVREGADELDMVIAQGALKAGDDRQIVDDVRAVVEASSGRPVKVILETGALGPDDIARAAQLAVEAGAAYVKTSTGFGEGGATVEAVRLLRKTVGPEIGVKASGGVRDALTAIAMIEAGADRIGASAGVAIVREAEKIGSQR